jgi:hypothetical protein
VNGLGLCAPGVAELAGWPWGERTGSGEQAPDLLPAALRRRVTPLTNAVARAVSQAVQGSGCDLARVPLVFGSAYGEVAAAIEMMPSFRNAEGLPSPTRFHNSVHNTSVAYLSIATVQRGFSTALAAGTGTPAAALIEAWALLSERGGEVLVVLADEPPPAPFAPANPYPLAAVALRLSLDARPGRRARLTRLRAAPPAQRPDLPGGLTAHPCAGAFALLESVARGAPCTVALGPFDEPGWQVDVAFEDIA